MADVFFPEGIRTAGAAHFAGLLTRPVTRAELAQTDLARYQVPLQSLRIWDAVQTVLTGTSGTDDLGIYGGTFGTNPMRVSTGDVKTVSVTRYARFQFQLPAEYIAAETVAIIVNAGCQTTAADGSATIDFEVYQVTDKTLSADLCATAAQSINSSTFAEKTFLITSTGLTAGDVLEARVTIASVDTATGTAVDPSFTELFLACDIKG